LSSPWCGHGTIRRITIGIEEVYSPLRYRARSGMETPAGLAEDPIPPTGKKSGLVK